jgi:hypothetical protein
VNWGEYRLCGTTFCEVIVYSVIICGICTFMHSWVYLWWVLHDLKLKMRWTGYMFILIWGEWYRMHIVMSRVTWHEILTLDCIRNVMHIKWYLVIDIMFHYDYVWLIKCECDYMFNYMAMSIAFNYYYEYWLHVTIQECCLVIL